MNESNDVMDAVLLVVRNDKEDLDKYLTKFSKMRVCGLARHGLEILSASDKRV